VYVYVRDADTAWEPPSEASREALTEHAAFGGMGTIFFIDNPAGCTNCMTRPTFDLHVDVTAALRAQGIHPKRAMLEVMVESADDSVAPLADTPVPVPTLKGPRLGSGLDIARGQADNDEEDTKELQRMLGQKDDGVAGPVTDAAIRKFQQMAGLAEDGVVGPKTRTLLAVCGLTKDGGAIPDGHKLVGSRAGGKTVTWSLDVKHVPASLRQKEQCEKFLAEMQSAFDAWSEPTGLAFVQVPEGGQLVLDFADRSDQNESVFDGPGGALAEATPSTITFDASEKWELLDVPHPHRAVEEEGGDSFWADASIFSVFVVGLHEVGHVIGLGHSDAAADVMSPYYLKTKVALTENDLARARALYVEDQGARAAAAAAATTPEVVAASTASPPQPMPEPDETVPEQPEPAPSEPVPASIGEEEQLLPPGAPVATGTSSCCTVS
jgi:hypothetical protein